MNKIVIFNHKGGSCKTTLSVAYAKYLSENHKVLLIDLDSQANASFTFGIRNNPFNISDIEKGYQTLEEVIIEVKPNLYLLPSNNKLVEVGNILKDIKGYDYIIYDLPPSIGEISQRVIQHATDVFIPFVPEPYSVDGLLNVVDFVGPRRLRGIVSCMLDKRSKEHRRILTQMDAYCKSEGIKVFDTVIPRSVDFIDLSKSTPKTKLLDNLFEEMELTLI